MEAALDDHTAVGNLAATEGAERGLEASDAAVTFLSSIGEFTFNLGFRNYQLALPELLQFKRTI